MSTGNHTGFCTLTKINVEILPGFVYNVTVRVLRPSDEYTSGRQTLSRKELFFAMYTVNAIRNICLLGHSGSGKSALAESLLYMTGAIDRMGKNADGNTVSDYDPEEIRRNISISTSVIPI